jgi:LuxR family maltose regulon positive regulatory protein
VARQRLLEGIDRGLDQGFVLLCAPAGFGKTALMADWASRSARRVAWVSLDTDDNDPVRFWRHVSAALDGIQPDAVAELGPLLDSDTPLKGFVAPLVNRLASSTDEVVLLFDDYHVIANETVHESLRFLLAHQPLQLHLVMSARADPPLPIARLRASGGLAELRAADLRFTQDEAASLLQGVVADADPAAAAQVLIARTEGWVAGLQLAALSLRDRDDSAQFLDSFTGSHRYVLDYLAQEVLERQPEDVRTFLRETSILGRLNADLCDAVTGRAGSQRILESIERAGLFVIPLDDTREWWRDHHLFADLLHVRLRQRQPGRVAELHRRAAEWHARHGFPREAIHHAVLADDPALANRLPRPAPGTDPVASIPQASASDTDDGGLPVEALSPRELEVLQLLARGKANREIARELFVTLDTVKKHVTHIFGKLEVSNRTQAAARARSLGMVP